MLDASETYIQFVSLTKNSDTQRSDRLLQPAYVNNSYQIQGQNDAKDFIIRTSAFRRRGLRTDSGLTHEDVVPRPTTGSVEYEAARSDY